MDHKLSPLYLGGDHAVTFPVVKAMSACHPRLSILHFDARPDLYDHYEGNRRSHASPFARIMETDLVKARPNAMNAAKVFEKIAAKMLEN
jgi:arginase family enzyme